MDLHSCGGNLWNGMKSLSKVFGCGITEGHKPGGLNPDMKFLNFKQEPAPQNSPLPRAGVTLPLSYVDCLEIWESQPPGTLEVCNISEQRVLFPLRSGSFDQALPVFHYSTQNRSFCVQLFFL